jgi:hypothetical protein
VNQVLLGVHPDVAHLRRELVLLGWRQRLFIASRASWWVALLV